MSTVVAKNLAVQNSAGTASTNISFDGNKLVSTALDNSITATANLHDLGVGQTWQNVAASRTFGVTYTNSTGRVISVSVSFEATTNNQSFIFLVNGLVIARAGSSGALSNGGVQQVFAIVPAGSTYSITSNVTTLVSWLEMR